MLLATDFKVKIIRIECSIPNEAKQNSKTKRQSSVTSFELYFTTNMCLPHSSGDYNSAYHTKQICSEIKFNEVTQVCLFVHAHVYKFSLGHTIVALQRLTALNLIISFS